VWALAGHHRPPTPDLGEQVREQLIAKQPVPFAVPHRPDRLVPDAALAQRRRATPQVGLLGVTAAVIGHSRTKNHINVILPETGLTSDHPRSGNTSHLRM
jgi:hypothetical protein